MPLIQHGVDELRTTLRQWHSSTLPRSFAAAPGRATALQWYARGRWLHDGPRPLNRIAGNPTCAKLSSVDASCVRVAW